jgi:hypothetical protein
MLRKVIKTLLARWLSAFAKREGLLLDSQIGNYTNKFTKTTLELLVKQIHIA